MDHKEPELSIMEAIYRSANRLDRITQRDLARDVGLSLGMTNAVVRSLVARGWVRLEKNSTRGVTYCLTAKGVAEVTLRTARSIRGASQGVGLYRKKLEDFVISAKNSGIETVVLSGESAVDLILEYLCERYGLVLVKSVDPERAVSLGRRPHVALLISEHGDSAAFSGIAAAQLSELLVGEASQGGL